MRYQPPISFPYLNQPFIRAPRAENPLVASRISNRITTDRRDCSTPIPGTNPTTPFSLPVRTPTTASKMASGIAMSKDCKTAYNALSKRDHSAVILKINDDMTEINVDRTVPPFGADLEAEWKAIVDSLPQQDSRFIVTDFSWRDSPTVTSSKIILILWTAEFAPIKKKMIYASSTDAVTADMTVQKTIQATDLDEISYMAVKKQVGK